MAQRHMLDRTIHATILMLAFFSAVSISTAPPAYAHKVNIFAYVENGTIFMESYFPDGKPVESGKIEILDARNQKITEGTTDKEGKFSIPVPKHEDLTIVIDASLGHRNTYLLKKDEMGE